MLSLVFNSVFNFFYLVKINNFFFNLDANVVLFNVKINFIIILIIPSATRTLPLGH